MQRILREAPLTAPSDKAPSQYLAPAGRTIPAHLKSRHQNVELAVALQLVLQSLKSLADKFGDLPATQARHVDVVALQPALVVMPFAIQMHQVKFIDHALALQQAKRAVNRA